MGAKCEYTIIVDDRWQACGKNAPYKVSQPNKPGAIIAEKYTCKEHMLEWKDFPNVTVEKL